MDVKNATNAIVPLLLRTPERVEKAIKSDSTTDRDANGQMFQHEQDTHEKMSEEQFQKALEHLRNLPAVKEHNLHVEWKDLEGKRIVYIKEATGKLFRRIAENELFELMEVKDNEKGQLIRKTA